mmetsp:Transcript_40360/g.48927  ORF Transcript_40360/g.48927 Transcript_40360/m.48927 type:complete len:194 (+) Transcript_40360:210-791(+)
MFNFNPEAAKAQKQKEKVAREASKTVAAWVKEEVARVAPQIDLSDTKKFRVEISEVQCGDPQCAPIDTVIRFWFESLQESLGLPMEMVEVQQEDIKEVLPPGDVLTDWYNGVEREWPEQPEMELPQLRFDVGARVQCCVDVNTWAAGTVVALWYRQANFPPGFAAPYQVKLDTGTLIFAPQDTDQCVRASQVG